MENQTETLPTFLGISFDTTVHLGDIVMLIPIIFALVGGIVSVNRFRRTLEKGNQAAKAAHYSELDRFYADLLKIAIEYPFLRLPKPIQEDDDALKVPFEPFEPSSSQHAQYEAYVYIVWNFIEAIHDRCQELCDCGDKESYESLRMTWEPVIRAENEIHRGWFLADMRRQAAKAKECARLGLPYRDGHKFCEGFRIFVLEQQWNDPSWAYRPAFKEPIDFGLDVIQEVSAA